jgi:outer membrane protein assembly factor BamE
MHPRRNAVVVLGLLAAGCATRELPTDSFLGVITPYRIDIVQGNAVTKEMVAAVRPGMSRAQVREVLGSPMLADPFHADRWDYLFSIRRPGTELQRRSVVVHFEGGMVKRIDAPDNLPTEIEFVAAIAPRSGRAVPRVLELGDDERKALPPPPKRESAPSLDPLGPARSYPPLEPK